MMKSTWHVYPATYADPRGSEYTYIFNNGAVLGIEIRGVKFQGSDFDSLRPVPETPPVLLKQFTLNGEDVCDCTITCDITQVVSTPAIRHVGVLHVKVCLGQPAANGGIDKEDLQLRITYGECDFTSQDIGGLFECSLLDLQKQMPTAHHLVNCFACAYADYFYGGQSMFGSMVCFRECKAEYLAVRTKDDYIAVWDKNAGPVQETGICPEFTRRSPKTGYRG